MKKQGLAPKTIQIRLLAIKQFFSFLRKRKAIDHDPLTILKIPEPHYRAKTKAFTDEEVRTMLNYWPTENPTAATTNAVLHVLFYLGLRASEVCNLERRGLREEADGWEIDVVRKGGLEQTFIVPDPCIEAIMQYLTVNNRKLDAYAEEPLPLFSRPGSPQKYERGSISRMVIRTAKECGIAKKVSAHSCRATCISNALDNGATKYEAQLLGGWSSDNMVEHYDKRKTHRKRSVPLKVNFDANPLRQRHSVADTDCRVVQKHNSTFKNPIGEGLPEGKET